MTDDIQIDSLIDAAKKLGLDSPRLAMGSMVCFTLDGKRRRVRVTKDSVYEISGSGAVLGQVVPVVSDRVAAFILFVNRLRAPQQKEGA